MLDVQEKQFKHIARARYLGSLKGSNFLSIFVSLNDIKEWCGKRASDICSDALKRTKPKKFVGRALNTNGQTETQKM